MTGDEEYQRVSARADFDQWLQSNDGLDFTQTVLEAVLHQLYIENKLDLSRRNNRHYLLELAHSAPQETYDNLRFNAHIDEEYVKTIETALAQKHYFVAVILAAAIIEHRTNQFYRSFLECKNIPEAQVTQIIKQSNLDVKLGWLLTVNHISPLPNDLACSIQEITDLRNALVHYKYIPTTLGSNEEFQSIQLLQKAEELSKVLFTVIENLLFYFKTTMDSLFPYQKEIREMSFFAVYEKSEQEVLASRYKYTGQKP